VDAQLKLDLDRMADSAADAGLVFLCNPNNPTATVHGAAAVRDFIAAVNRRAPDAVVMVDEAYHEYVDDPSYATAIPLAMENPKSCRFNLLRLSCFGSWELILFSADRCGPKMPNQRVRWWS